MQEKKMETKNGFVGLLFACLCIGGAILLFFLSEENDSGIFAVLGILLLVLGILLNAGLKVIKPQEAAVFTLFGKYSGVIDKEGFYFINPFNAMINPAAGTVLGQSSDVKVAAGVNSKKISLKIMTLNNGKQKVNDILGNPVDIGIAVTWKVVNPTKAVFNVDNYKEFLSLQCDSAVRNIVRTYPYDVAPNIDTTGDGLPDEGSLRGSSGIVAEKIKSEIQSKVETAGIEILEAKITHLAYSQEIAAVMLQRQQATAIVDARTTIVEGAVGMVEMALEKLEEQNIVDLDDERKAAMVSNLLVVLCGNKDTQPIVNSGSLY